MVLAHIQLLSLLTMLSPLAGSIIAGVFGFAIGPKNAHRITILLMIVSFVCAAMIFNAVVVNDATKQIFTLFTWGESGSVHFSIGLLIDHLSAMMITVVTFVSLFVHVYSIGYMDGDPGYQRFFSYVSLFTFAMLCLVMSNNFVLLFFGWEGVGLVSYLLIGFWFKKDSATFGSLKAFIVNRVGDLGFILAIACVLAYFGSVNYETVFQAVPSLLDATMSIIPGHSWHVITVICLLLFVGAAGKSAQVPLHVWLPESMEGPTPISALIHAATMVTAGVYMICRMSPLFEHSTVALSVVLVLGSITCLFMGLLGVVQFDIKRVIAYSTLSQLGYMMIGVGASAYSAGMFHLLMHAFFKALLFLCAGSVIIGMHHEQDMRKMGGLWRYMPVTWICFLVGGLALSAIPPFSGFYSKDSIIDAVHLASTPGASFAYFCALTGAFLTALYTFRAFFLTFHGKEKIPTETKKHLKESPWTVLLPLIVLAIPSAFLGAYAIKPMLYENLLKGAVSTLPGQNPLTLMAPEFKGWLDMALDAVTTIPFWFAIAGVVVAYVFNLVKPQWCDVLKKRFSLIYAILMGKYGFDDFNQIVIVRGIYCLGKVFYEIGDLKIVDGWFVNGSGKLIVWLSARFRGMQTGYVYHYALSMIIGLFVLLAWVWIGK